MLKVLKMTWQIAVLWFIYWLGEQISSISGLPIPGSIFGMTLLFLLLLCGIIKLEQVQHGADFLIKHMMFFFVTIAVGLMNSVEIFYEYGIILVAALLVGLFLPLATVGLLVQFLHRGEKECSR